MHQPAVEYVKGALQLVRDNFSYESVFRFLRTGMTALTMDEIDRLDLYVMKWESTAESSMDSYLHAERKQAG